jgi:uncharacterized RDD family membrane protein YckC
MQNLQLADGGKRFIAFLIDVIILTVVSMILFGILGAVGIMGASSAETSDTAGMMAAMMGASLLVNVVALAIQVGYFTYFESSDRQGTIGKTAMGLIVADENGNRLDTQKALIRNIMRLVSGMICLIGYLMAFFTDKKQTLHDIVAKTNVYTKPV